MTGSVAPASALGRRVVRATRSSRGYTQGWRGRVELDDGRSAFVKVGHGSLAGALEHEAKVLAWLERQGHVSLGPRLLDFTDGGLAMLVLEDLSDAEWPPPYPADTTALFDALAELSRLEAPSDLEQLVDWADGSASRWATVAADSTAFLRLGACSPAWLDANIGALIEGEKRVDLAGIALVHNDVWSANLCFADGRAKLIDWATAARGNADLDVAFAIVSVLAEGGQLPGRRLLNDEGAWAARLAGHNAIEASSPLPAWAEPGSTLRQDQLTDLRAALLWAARALDLEPPIGHHVG